MRKQEFQEQEKIDITSKYKDLRKQKKTRPEALKILADEYGYSTSTISDIMNRTSYRKPLKKLAS